MEVKRDLFVFFEYIAGDPSLCVELILPFPAFAEFCNVNDALMLEPDTPKAASDFKKTCEDYGTVPCPSLSEEHFYVA